MASKRVKDSDPLIGPLDRVQCFAAEQQPEPMPRDALHPGARLLLDEWRCLLRRPLDALLPVLTDPVPWARELRHVTPVTGILSAAERAQAYRAFAQRARDDPLDRTVSP